MISGNSRNRIQNVGKTTPLIKTDVIYMVSGQIPLGDKLIGYKLGIQGE